MQFYNDIKINNIDMFSRFNIKSVGIDQDTERVFGLDRSARIENNSFVMNEGTQPNFTVQLCKVSNNGVVLPVNDNELSDLARLLFKDGISTIEHNGMMYYGVFENGTSWFNGGRQGYLTLKFQLVSDKAYSKIMQHSVRVSNEKIVEIYNKSTASNYICMDINFELLSGNSIEIHNMTTGKVFKINNMEDLEHGTVYGKEMEIISNVDIERNLFNLHEGDFSALRLVYGKNIIKIICNGRINILKQDELCFI